MIYLDSAATSLLKPPSVSKAVLRAIRTMASPGRGSHRPAMLAAEEVYNCRVSAAELFNEEEPERIVFTMNATHGLNIAIKSLCSRGDRVVISGFEHNSVLRPLRALGADICVCGRRLFDREEFLSSLEKNLRGAKLAVVSHVSNAFGYILPIYEAAELCRKYSVPLIIDASQSAGILDVDAKRLNAAFIAMPGHKGLLGPQGTGILICGDCRAKTIFEGGSGSDSASAFMPEYLPDRLEAGTANVCGIAGLRAGLNYIKTRGRENILCHENKLLKIFRDNMSQTPYELFSGDDSLQSSLISLRHPLKDCEALSTELKERGVCVRCGLHCAPLAHESAGTLKTGTVRISFSPFLSEKEILKCCGILREIV